MSNPSLEEKLAKLAIRDPLGEIAARAQELWRDAGSPSDRAWHSFLDQAEKDLLAGRGHARSLGHSCNHPAVTADNSANAKTISTSPVGLTESSLLVELRARARGALLALANIFEKPLVDHEVRCLIRLLRTHRIVFNERAELSTGGALGPLTLESALELILPLTEDYPASWLAKFQIATVSEIPDAVRLNYWNDLIRRHDEQDPPLTAADRNTLHRLFSLFANHPLINSITNQEI